MECFIADFFVKFGEKLSKFAIWVTGRELFYEFQAFQGFS